MAKSKNELQATLYDKSKNEATLYDKSFNRASRNHSEHISLVFPVASDEYDDITRHITRPSLHYNIIGRPRDYRLGNGIIKLVRCVCCIFNKVCWMTDSQLINSLLFHFNIQ